MYDDYETITNYVKSIDSPEYVMDENEVLEKIRTLLKQWPANAWRGEMLAKLFTELDEWLSQGGNPPADWDWNHLSQNEEL